jgi:putative pyruvate formate lyase activating enzyme
VPQILEALPMAIEGGLRLPIVYNTSSYDSLDSLALMDGIVDIYMPDLKIFTPGRARRYLRMPGYPQAARQAVAEMNRQVGPLRFGEKRPGPPRAAGPPPGDAGNAGGDQGDLAMRGRGTRHRHLCDLMAQYHPAGLVGGDHRDGYHEIDRQPARDEYDRAAEYADELGLQRLDQRSRASALLLPRT